MTRSESFDVAKAFAQVAQDIARNEDVREMRLQIVRLAESSLGAAGASIWHLKANNTMALDAGTDASFLQNVEQILARHPDGPSWQALHTGRIVVGCDHTVEKRWPDFVRALLEQTPVRSSVAYPLHINDENLGVLSVYSEEPGHFTDALVQMGEVFAAHATLALEKAYAVQKVDNLVKALASNRRIGMAIGILMAENKIVDEQAFDLLRICSQHTHRKLAEVAEDVILTGALPHWRLRLVDDLERDAI